MEEAASGLDDEWQITLESIKMSRDFGTKLQGLYPFNHIISCKKSKVHLIFDLVKKEFSRLDLN